ncbi:MAG: YfhO family protein [Candidatus Levybacteria bacterium]|nr:YfhO family protein [Candidatus Levybacteria bacterium]
MKLLKVFWPILFLVVIWFVFSSPYFLQGRVPFASTYQVNFFAPWNAYPGFSGPVKNNAMPDVISQIYPWKTFTIDSLKQGILPLWNPYSFSGTAHLANYQSAVLTPLNLLFFILPFIDAWSIAVLLQPLLAGLFMYLYLRSLLLKNFSVTVGSVSFMFCGFITTWMGYETLGYAILFLPLALFAIEKFYALKTFKYLFLLSISLPLSFFSGHFQISLYFLIFVLLYLIYKYLQTRNLKFFIYTFLYFLFGLFLTMPQVLVSIEAYGQSLRSGIFQKTEIIPWGYVATFFAPDMLGNPVTRNDWFGHYAEWNGFAGTITIILALYTLFSERIKKVWFFIFTAVLSILLCFPSPVIDLIVFLKVPVLSTSAASRIIVLFSFSIAVLSSFGIEWLFEDLKKQNKGRIIYWLIATLIIFALLWVVVLGKLILPIDKIIIARQNLILPTLLLASLVSVFVLSFISLKIKKLNKLFIILPFVIVVLISFDLFRFANKWQEFSPKSLAFPKVAVEEKFREISGFERVYGNLGGEATIYYKLPTVVGYDAVYNQRYGQFIASLQNGDLENSARSVVSFPENGLYSRLGLNFLNVRYFVHKIADGRSPWVFPFWNYPDEFNSIYDDGVYQIFENTKAYKRAFLVDSYKVRTDPQEILNAMLLEDLDLTKTLVLEKDISTKLGLKKGSATIDKYLPNEVTIKTVSDGNSLLFLSDPYYPGWKALVDGKESEILRSDFAFRSVIVPKGEHTVKFVYDPISFKLGLILFGLGLVSMVLVVFLRGRFMKFAKI